MPAFFTCVINGTTVDTTPNPGMPSPVISVTLTDSGGTFTQTVFSCADTGKREMLAVALAAISTQSPVSAFLDPPVTPPWNCYTLSLLAR